VGEVDTKANGEADVKIEVEENGEVEAEVPGFRFLFVGFWSAEVATCVDPWSSVVIPPVQVRANLSIGVRNVP
jgi:hypothetical protein